MAGFYHGDPYFYGPGLGTGGWIDDSEPEEDPQEEPMEEAPMEEDPMEEEPEEEPEEDPEEEPFGYDPADYDTDSAAIDNPEPGDNQGLWVETDDEDEEEYFVGGANYYDPPLGDGEVVNAEPPLPPPLRDTFPPLPIFQRRPQLVIGPRPIERFGPNYEAGQSSQAPPSDASLPLMERLARSEAHALLMERRALKAERDAAELRMTLKGKNVPRSP